jgi:putative drug exporter of the RND superfamily
MHIKVAGVFTGRITKWITVVFWIAVVAVLGPLAGKLTGIEDNEASSWLPASAESTKNLTQQEKFHNVDVLPAIIVYERPSGITDADRELAAEQIDQVKDIQYVVSDEVAGPIVSQDGQAMSVLVPIDIGQAGWDALADVIPDMRDDIGTESDHDGLTIQVTGPAGVNGDFATAFEGIDGRLLIAAGIVVIVLLLLTYRSPVLWIFPLLSAVVALVAAQGVIYLLANGDVITVNAQSTGILAVLVFGAGTDYALLLTARYREELRRHQDRHEAMTLALHRAGPAIIASAATVVIGMLCLTIAELNSTSGMGPVLAIGIAVGMLAMLTLLPALLVIFGRWVFWPMTPHFGSADHTAEGIWARLGRRIAIRPRTVWIVTSLVLAVMALGVFRLDAKGLSYEDSFVNKPESITGQEIYAQHFDAGGGQPIVVISNEDAAADVTKALEAVDGVAEVTKPQVQDGLALVNGTMNVGADSEQAQSIVEQVRDSVHSVPGADATVGGDTAILVDTLDAADRDNKVIIPIVLAVVLLILMVLLRAILSPVILLLTVVLSYLAALGVSAIVFRDVFGFGGADAGLPLFVFVFLVALGIDYNIFLMTRVREESLKYGTRRGSLIGLTTTGGVITAAGLVLAGTFAALGTIPMVFLAEIGFAVAFGVLLDTLIVRSVLVTSLNLDIGRRIWWPSQLAHKEDVDESDMPSEDRALVSADEGGMPGRS